MLPSGVIFILPSLSLITLGDTELMFSIQDRTLPFDVKNLLQQIDKQKITTNKPTYMIFLNIISESDL